MFLSDKTVMSHNFLLVITVWNLLWIRKLWTVILVGWSAWACVEDDLSVTYCSTVLICSDRVYCYVVFGSTSVCNLSSSLGYRTDTACGFKIQPKKCSNKSCDVNAVLSFYIYHVCCLMEGKGSVRSLTDVLHAGKTFKIWFDGVYFLCMCSTNIWQYGWLYCILACRRRCKTLTWSPFSQLFHKMNHPVCLSHRAKRKTQCQQHAVIIQSVVHSFSHYFSSG